MSWGKENCFKVNNTSTNSWYLDIGCSRHMPSDKIHLIKLNPKSGEEVTFGDNSKGQIGGIGSIGKNSSIFIENVLYVNDLKYNLLSIGQLYDKGLNVIFYSNGCKVINVVCKIMLVGHRIRNIYMVNLDELHDSNVCLIAKNENSS
ncbi:hypothetical protein V6Z12_D02G175800 [Gossypium hirsutum]